MAEMAGPIELLDLPDGGTLTTKILRYDEGDVTIQVGPTKIPKVVQTLRIHVPPEGRPPGMPYWDITSKTLRAQLIPLLTDIMAKGRTVKITKHGVAPLARFTLEIV